MADRPGACIRKLSGVAGRRRDVPSVELVTGDACDVDVLAAAGTGAADVVAAVTGDDEDNLVVSLLAAPMLHTVLFRRVPT